jgi:hypothetical protein
MLEVKTFVCEKCGRRYGKPEVAACCEQGHEMPTHIGEYIRYRPANKFPDLIEIMFGQKKVVYKRAMGNSRPMLKKKDDDALFDFDNDDDDD